MKSGRIDTIFFDLDGTLINPQKRLHTLFVELSGSQIGYDDYWKCKGEGLNQSRMLERVGYQYSYELFKNRWLEEVERKDLLLLDKVFDDVPPTLDLLKNNGIRIGTVTNRQSYENLMWELCQFGIRDYFSFIITTYQKCSKDAAILKEDITFDTAVFVSDNREDMDATEAPDMIRILLRREETRVTENIVSEYCISSLSELRGILF